MSDDLGCRPVAVVAHMGGEDGVAPGKSATGPLGAGGSRRSIRSGRKPMTLAYSMSA